MELFNPHSKEWFLNKFETYKLLQTMDTAYYSEQYNGYLITKYDDVKFALKNDKIFTSARGNLIIESPKRFGLTLGASADPMHGMLKDIVKEAYSKKNIERIFNCFVEKSTDILLQSGSTIDISNIVREVSAWTSTEILNLPYDKVEIQQLLVGILKHSEQVVLHNTDRSYYDDFLIIVKKLLNDGVEPEGPGIYNEFFKNAKDSNFMSLFTGPTISGASSLAGALGFLTVDIFREKLFGTLANDRSLIPGLVNESLRFNSSSGRKVRTVTQDVTLHNVQLKRGDKVILALEAANRDPNMFENPNNFSITRNNAGSLAFGYGMHACIATVISKELMQGWVEVLLDTVGKYKLITKPNKFDFLMTSSGNQDTINNLIIKRLK